MTPLPRSSLPLAITALLAVAVLVYQGPHLRVALEPEDTNHLETPLARAVAGQLEAGPGGLYGPYSGSRPEVLIHAPLYYRLAGLLAWPLVRGLGWSTTAAALAGGRLLALLGLALTLLAAARLARLDGGPRRAALWSGLLIAGAPLVGSLPVTVRADMLGVGLQLLGLALALDWLATPAPERHRVLIGSAVALALAVCVRQNAVVMVGLIGLLVIAAVVRGRAPRRPVLGALGLGLALVLAYYGLEQWVTAGQMLRCVFALPARFGQIAPAGLAHARTVAIEAVSRSVGLLALSLAVLVAGLGRQLRTLDAVLLALVAVEVVLAVALCRNSTGAWVNYYMPAVVLLSIVLGRVLGRWSQGPIALAPLGLIALALLGLVARNADLALDSARNRARSQAELATLLAHPAVVGTPSEQRYFAGDPARNRLAGATELTHDEWLYERFEAVGAAEPRTGWLAGALTTGPVTLVCVPDDGRRGPDDVPGLDRPLDQLGYEPLGVVGGQHLWVRRTVAAPVTPWP